jgi:nucleoside-diphosphate-sugar epimerase
VPSSPLNVTGPRKLSVRWLAQELGKRLGRAVHLTGREADSAWIVDTTAAQQLLGAPRVPLEAMLDWTADWVGRGGPSLGKETHFEVRDGKY